MSEQMPAPESPVETQTPEIQNKRRLSLGKRAGVLVTAAAISVTAWAGLSGDRNVGAEDVPRTGGITAPEDPELAQELAEQTLGELAETATPQEVADVALHRVNEYLETEDKESLKEFDMLAQQIIDGLRGMGIERIEPSDADPPEWEGRDRLDENGDKAGSWWGHLKGKYHYFDENGEEVDSPGVLSFTTDEIDGKTVVTSFFQEEEADPSSIVNTVPRGEAGEAPAPAETDEAPAPEEDSETTPEATEDEPEEEKRYYNENGELEITDLDEMKDGEMARYTGDGFVYAKNAGEEPILLEGQQ